MDYHIYHMFPKLLNLYGDQGNITTLAHFAKQIGLNPVIHKIDDVSQIDWKHIDFMLIGGGSDREQALVTNMLSDIKDRLKLEIENGLPVLAVCGGYQFLGKYYQDSSGNRMEGLSIVDMYTIGQTKERIVGNTIVDTENFSEIIGFVNHAGETFHNLKPFGQSRNIYGNNLQTRDEGLIYHNLIGTYLHGPILPKNPVLTIHFLKLFCTKNNINLDTKNINVEMEEKARIDMCAKILKDSKK